MARFEDVVARPEETLGEVFAFLGVAMPENLSVTRVFAHGLASGGASESGIDPAAADRWRGHIGPFANRLLSLLLRGWMKRLGY